MESTCTSALNVENLAKMKARALLFLDWHPGPSVLQIKCYDGMEMQQRSQMTQRGRSSLNNLCPLFGLCLRREESTPCIIPRCVLMASSWGLLINHLRLRATRWRAALVGSSRGICEVFLPRTERILNGNNKTEYSCFRSADILWAQSNYAHIPHFAAVIIVVPFSAFQTHSAIFLKSSP